MQGIVKTIIDVRPANTVSFRGKADAIPESVIELVAAAEPFHITRIDTNLEDKIAHRLETVEEGKRYNLKLKNLLDQGAYNGVIRLQTDLARKSDIMIRVNGAIEGEISVIPRTLLVGKLAAQQPVRAGKATVSRNSGKPFKITSLTYDEKVIRVTRDSAPDQTGFSLEIEPIMENVPPGERMQTLITIETDVASEGKQEVRVQIFNAAEPANSKTPQKP